MCRTVAQGGGVKANAPLFCTSGGWELRMTTFGLLLLVAAKGGWTVLIKEATYAESALMRGLRLLADREAETILKVVVNEKRAVTNNELERLPRLLQEKSFSLYI